MTEPEGVGAYCGRRLADKLIQAGPGLALTMPDICRLLDDYTHGLGGWLRPHLPGSEALVEEMVRMRAAFWTRIRQVADALEHNEGGTA